MDVTKLDDAGVRNLIDNHRAKGMTTAPNYLAALEEWERRKGRGLDFGRSLGIIRRAAAERRFLSYKDIADESGLEWNKVHYAVNDHVNHLVEYAHARGWPMISAIIVNKHNQQTGEMDAYTHEGFLSAARWLGREILNERTFLKEEQERVFAWAQTSAEPQA